MLVTPGSERVNQYLTIITVRITQDFYRQVVEIRQGMNKTPLVSHCKY